MTDIDMTLPPRPSIGQVVSAADGSATWRWSGVEWIKVLCSIICLDCETTGLQPDRHTIWEIAWVTALHMEDGSLRVQRSREYMPYLNPKERAKADPSALAIGRFPERWRGEISPAAVKLFLQSDCKEVTFGQPPHLVGAVPSFDHNMLCVNWLGWPGYKEGYWSYHLVDVEVLAAGKLGIAPPYSSEELCAALGVEVPMDRRHTAMGDVGWAMEIYARVYGLEIM